MRSGSKLRLLPRPEPLEIVGEMKRRSTLNSPTAQVRTACVATLVLLLAMVAGCGSSATTGPAEARAVDVAEHQFGVANRRAAVDARARCLKKKTGQADQSCYQRLFAPREEKLRAA